MSEHITHIAIYEDASRLVAYSNGLLNDAFKISIKNQPDAGLVSCASRGNHLFAIPIVEQVRDIWKTRKKDDGAEKKLAAAQGWLCHRAMDLQVKPIYLKMQEIQSPRYAEEEHQIYYDAVTFDKVYGSGKYPSVSPKVFISRATLEHRMHSHPGSALVHEPQMEALMCSLVQQNLLALRKFNTTKTNIDDWLDAFPNHYQDLSENLETYIEAYEHPDPIKQQMYEHNVHGFDFYTDTDELILLVRELQHKGTSNISLIDALDRAEKQSHYAQGLRRAFNFISIANAFFERKMEKDKVYDELGIFEKDHRR